MDPADPGRTGLRATLPQLLLLLAFAGCGSTHEGARDGAVDQGESADGAPDASVPCADQLDVLVVVHDRTSSGFWLTSQLEFLSRELETLVTRGLDVRVSLMSGDMGAAGHDIPDCSGSGDDGALLADDGCGEATLQVEPGGAESTANQLLCLLDGQSCPFFRPFDALAKYSSPPATRPGSRVLLAFLTPTDDCSASSPAFYDLASDEFEGSTLERCVLNPDALRTIENVRSSMDGWAATQLAVLLRGGIPPELSGNSSDAILSDDEFQRVAAAGEDICGGRMGSPPMVAAQRLVGLSSSLEADGASVLLQSGCVAITRADDDTIADWLSCRD